MVRHGQTSGNIAKRHQIDDSQLTFRGEAQAREVAERMKAVRPTHLICSNLLRAVETARVISEVCDLIPETSSLMVEQRRPNALRGSSRMSLRSFWFYTRWYFEIGSPEQGEETYTELRDRIVQAKAFIAKHPADARVVVVSHGVFINFFLAHLCRDKALSPIRAFITFLNLLWMPNGKVTKLTYTETVAGTCGWSVER